ncbi:MAG: HD-GYP domain-containing protein [Gammaproteobacteria bacterium]|nr:HD-GYP domain-containing protein [Gammaproteobacteria bacterium]MDH3370563.1 HD-GYP domain-containing protein [Gammaproteobacteria bacterium]MDH3406356.1 HD-GYP domain-containing protein [Gammaproteobacteria bacterium]MDH5486802.1 HD-GYP domain-containing protein [Gammaproteobacteria bacterium]
MAIAKKKISTLDLKPGMYVSQLDRPWREAEVLFQGFYVNSLEQIEELRNKFRFVYVDTWRDIPPGKTKLAIKEDTLDEELRNLCGHPKRDNVYKDSTSVEEELVIAQEVHKQATITVGEMMRNLQMGQTLKLAMIHDVVTGLMESILRNPDAFSWLMHLKKKDTYSYTHSIDTCALAVTFGRHLGLPHESLISLGTGALLFDVGKVKLPEGLLNKPGRLSPEEFQIMKKHVDYGVDIVGTIKGSGMEMVDMVRAHHERFDGSGYPLGTRGSDIPLFGRMAGILDWYDAITSNRSYQQAISPHQALRVLYNARDKAFQEELVEQFIQCLGVYPTGSLVEMISGEVGIVIAQNRVRRLRPKIMLILNHNKVALENFEIVDLDRELPGKNLEIAKVLPPGAYGINPKEYYLGE